MTKEKGEAPKSTTMGCLRVVHKARACRREEKQFAEHLLYARPKYSSVFLPGKEFSWLLGEKEAQTWKVSGTCSKLVRARGKGSKVGSRVLHRDPSLSSCQALNTPICL